MAEYWAGTNPTDSNSFLRITLVQPLLPGTLQIYWRGGTSGVPVLQTNLTLRTNDWFDFLTNTMPGTNGTFTVTNLPPAGQFKAFRLRLER